MFRPFVDGGVVYRHVSAGNTIVFGPDNPNTTGFAVGSGVTLKLLLVRLTPEIRCTHWFTPLFQNGNLAVQSTTNQADFLLGVFFKFSAAAWEELRFRRWTSLKAFQQTLHKEGRHLHLLCGSVNTPFGIALYTVAARTATCRS